MATQTVEETAAPVKKSKKTVAATQDETVWLNPDDIVIVGLDTEDGPEHPLYDERIKLASTTLETLVQDIMDLGLVHTPINVVKSDDGTMVVVSGRRRVLASREVNKRLKKNGQPPIQIQASIRKSDEGNDEKLIGIMISENELRREDEYQTKAEKAGRLVAAGYTKKWVARRFGVTETAVEQWLKFNSLNPKVKAAVKAKKLSSSAAVELAGLGKEEQVEELEGLLKSSNGKKVTTEKAKSKAKSKKGEEPGKPTAYLLKKVAAHCAEYDTDLDESMINVLRWVTGELPASKIKGLAAIIKFVTEE